jgi:hypothetical protein
MVAGCRWQLLLFLFCLFPLGCTSIPFGQAPEPTPPPPTLTPVESAVLERDREFRALSEDEKLSRLTAAGVRVIHQSLVDDTNDDSITIGCPTQFPVAAIDEGWYFLPSDEIYSTFWIFPRLCFLTEQDAVSAGYQRGPH